MQASGPRPPVRSFNRSTSPWVQLNSLKSTVSAPSERAMSWLPDERPPGWCPHERVCAICFSCPVPWSPDDRAAACVPAIKVWGSGCKPVWNRNKVMQSPGGRMPVHEKDQQQVSFTAMLAGFTENAPPDGESVPADVRNPWPEDCSAPAYPTRGSSYEKYLCACHG